MHRYLWFVGGIMGNFVLFFFSMLLTIFSKFYTMNVDFYNQKKFPETIVF